MSYLKHNISESFPNEQFKIPGYALPCRLDHNQFGGGIMVFVKEDIPSRVLSLNKSVESLFIELNFGKKSGFFAVHIILTDAIFQITLTY